MSKRQAKKNESKNPKAEKVCPVCARPFHWRARWKNNWEEVVYCSRRCSKDRRLRSESARHSSEPEL
ncbi:MAG: DUF2256 domain-containing protein [Pseudomonadota bacterium]